MGNEKWILYNNVEQNRSWCKQNKPPPPHQSLVFIQRKWCCIYGGIGREFSINKELLPENQMINSNKYCPQLDKLQAALGKKHLELVNRKCIIFHQDNARSHISLMTRWKLLQLGWEVLIHLPDSPDIALLDVHLFQSL